MAVQDWENFFQSLNEILDDAECATNQQLLEVVGLRLENAVSVLQQVVSLVPGENESGQVLMAILRNFPLLSAAYRSATLFSDSCSSVAIHSLDIPPVVQSGKVGRPKFEISEEVLLQFRRLGFTWTQIAEMIYTGFSLDYRKKTIVVILLSHIDEQDTSIAFMNLAYTCVKKYLF